MTGGEGEVTRDEKGLEPRTKTLLRFLFPAPDVPPLYAFVSASLTDAVVVTAPDLLRNAVLLKTDATSSTFVEGCTIDIAQLVRAIVAQQDVDAIQKVGSAGADGLEVVLAKIHHLLEIDGSDLGVPLPGDLGVEESSSLDEIRAGLGDVEPPCLGETALTAVRDQSAPAAELAQGREAQDVADKGDVDGSAVLANALDRLQMALGMKLAIKRTHGLQA